MMRDVTLSRTLFEACQLEQMNEPRRGVAATVWHDLTRRPATQSGDPRRPARGRAAHDRKPDSSGRNPQSVEGGPKVPRDRMGLVVVEPRALEVVF